ncbi:hypothetical protein ISN45_Aa04g003750 [Arabidopsis thaliana x Arabidopsis arenosa]|uniref:Uncharacterized protein n=1 Tax=Arabidopsis thaliana x Arabidopsis arenosa TaxID=1240361 RepID=A0A8T2A2T0_9BRAS|nr:hypothetical protein ISN45_Aa04g003750 [Arabidopsis thaliana x Arabidopsis arenosa]
MDKTWVWLPRASLEYGEGASNFVYASARRLADDVVVGEGEFCSIEQTYKIGRIQLGPNAVAIIVKSVLKEEAYVIVDNDDLSTTANKTASSTKLSTPRRNESKSTTTLNQTDNDEDEASRSTTTMNCQTPDDKANRAELKFMEMEM